MYENNDGLWKMEKLTSNIGVIVIFDLSGFLA